MALKAVLMRIAAILPDAVQQGLRTRYRAVRSELALLRAAHYDWRQYRGNSGVLAPHRREVLEASIIKNYHRIEKGLALRSPRLGFGQEAIELLLAETRGFIARFGPSRVTAEATQTLDEYLRFNAREGHPLGRLEAEIADLRLRHQDTLNCECGGGTLQITRETIQRDGRRDLRGFFATRHSIRQFSEQPIDMALITDAVVMAQKSPSVCNRQSGRVFVVSEKALQAKLLALQNGNRGFGDQADKLLIVGADLDCFLSVGERYQAWIDGGMFAMSLIYALHSLGLGSCCLNWSVEPESDRALRQAAGLPDNISIIMLLAVGHLPEALRVAQSPRRPLAEVMQTLAEPLRNGSKPRMAEYTE